jgi:hypothetical protein
MEVVFENDCASIIYEEDLKVLIIKRTNKKLSPEEYQKPFKIALNFIRKKPIDNYISDIRDQAIISPDYRKWLQEVMMPEV